MTRRIGVGCALAVASIATFACSDRAGDRSQPAGEAQTPAPSAAAPTGAPTAIGALPASFAGDLPCADCAGLHYQLLVRPDGVYFLRRTYRAPEAGTGARRFDEIGRWTLQDSTLVLRGGREAPDLFRVRGPDHLRKLDLQGKDIESKLNYHLERESSPAVLEPALRMTGMVTATADSTVFLECLTGMRLRVVDEADHAALRRAASGALGGSALFASVEGRIVAAAAAAGEQLVVTKLERVFPGESCAPGAAANGVAGRDWILVEAGGTGVPAAMRRLPFLHIDAATGTVQGFAGCNTFRGPYKLEDGTLHLGPLAATLMACPDSPTENAFLAALNATARWQVRDGHLELVGSDGRTLARLAPRRAGSGGGAP